MLNFYISHYFLFNYLMTTTVEIATATATLLETVTKGLWKKIRKLPHMLLYIKDMSKKIQKI